MLVAGTQSGCGKTSISLALMQHAYNHGLRMAPFKAGPDFIDPMWHRCVCGHDSWNLDTRMMGQALCRQTYAEHCQADCVIIEGVMGMFDGAGNSVGGEGSSVHLAKTLGVPLCLVFSAQGLAGSVVPLIEGFVFRAKAMGVNIVGVIANHVGSDNHAKLLQRLLTEHHLPPLLAWMQKHAPQLPSRHLGLCLPSELELPDFTPFFHIIDEAGLHQAMQPISRVNAADKKNLATDEQIQKKPLYGRHIAIAHDAAFCFIYPANVHWLQQQGATLHYFSPLNGEALPEACDVLWLPGGYPELHADALAVSPTLSDIRHFVASDGRILAECGGMMLLGIDIDGVPMANILPCRFEMQSSLVALGYRQTHQGMRGHEFHHSRRIACGKAMPSAFEVKQGDAGIQLGNLRASYIHWYFASQTAVALSWFNAHSQRPPAQ